MKNYEFQITGHGFNDEELIRIIGAEQLEKFQNVIEQLTLR